MKWNQLFRYSVYRNLLVYFVLLVALVVVAVSSTLYFFFATKTEETISNNVISMLRQTSYTSSIIQGQIQTIGNHLLNNNRIITVLRKPQHDQIEDRDAMDILLDIQSAYPFIKYIGVYNDNTKRYLNTAGTPYQLNDKEKEWITGTRNVQFIGFFPQKLQSGFSLSSTQDHILTFILRPNYALTNAYKGAIVIHVNEQYILNTIKSIRSSSDDVFVMDEKGLVLSHTNSEDFMQSFATKPYIQKILNSTKKSDHFVTEVEGRKQLVTFVESNELNWYFVSVKPYNLLISDISTLKNFTWLLALVIILLGVLLAYFAANRLYNPLGRLISKVYAASGNTTPGTEQNRNEFALLSEAFSNVIDQASSVDIEIKQSLPVLKKAYLQHLLKGTLQDLSSTHVIQSNIDAYFTSPYYTVLLAQIDNYDDFHQQHNQKKQGLFRFSICNISNELLLKHVNNETIVMDEKNIAILLFLGTPTVPAHILITLAEIQEVIRSYFNFTISFSVGDSVSLRNEIHLSFESAQEYAKYRLFYGHQSIIHQEMIPDPQNHTSLYPNLAEKKLNEALRLSHADKTEQALDQFVKAMKEMTYYQALSCANQLLNSLMRDFDGALNIMQEHSKEYYDTVNQLHQKETLQEIHFLLQSFCRLIQTLTENKNISKTTALIDSICSYLQKNYHEPDLGIETIAANAQLTPSYLGKLFRSHSQMSFNDYLKNIRLEEAKKLLLNTNDPITVISEKVGVLNTTYFFTLFKKTYGISPNQYREQNTLS
ncbi:AraC family transcriptional regulator [Paenibacillus psychroresistens]|uniref:AraC family transcriptional regulator n=1 Tax=Paenibacillus psychroresistens TaxID=1778678 RepID=A0A6B8RIG2_9BACL|nr:AraC family transcriptional regulator [Paenibacillus psychroresistens]QGQ95138.1 AraC family transcriptional regulator [Paenibacillus psychroresistens]